MQAFGLIALLFLLAAAVPGVQVLQNFLATGQFELLGRGLLVLLLSVAGAGALVLGLLADMIKGQRAVQEEILYELRLNDD